MTDNGTTPQDTTPPPVELRTGLPDRGGRSSPYLKPQTTGIFMGAEEPTKYLGGGAISTFFMMIAALFTKISTLHPMLSMFAATKTYGRGHDERWTWDDVRIAQEVRSGQPSSRASTESPQPWQSDTGPKPGTTAWNHAQQAGGFTGDRLPGNQPTAQSPAQAETKPVPTAPRPD